MALGIKDDDRLFSDGINVDDSRFPMNQLSPHLPESFQESRRNGAKLGLAYEVALAQVTIGQRPILQRCMRHGARRFHDSSFSIIGDVSRH